MVAKANGRYGYFGQDRGWNMIRNGLEFKLFGRGKITTTGLEAACFLNPTDPEAEPTHEAYCIPIMYLNAEQSKTIKEDFGVSIQVVLLKPRSAGDVRLASANPDDMPVVNPNFLKDPHDMAEMIKGLRYFRKTTDTKPLADKIERVVAPLDYSDEGFADALSQGRQDKLSPCRHRKDGG